MEDRVPDARTIWLFREKLTTAGVIKRLFEQFDAMLRQAGYIAMSGQIVDASLVAAPRQRNTDDEKKAIKQGRTETIVMFYLVLKVSLTQRIDPQGAYDEAQDRLVENVISEWNEAA